MRRSGLAMTALVVVLVFVGGCGKHIGGSSANQVGGASSSSVHAAATSAPSASPLSAQALAGKLAATGIEEGSGFTITRAMTCGKGRDPKDPSVHCTTVFADAARGGRPASLEIMIFDGAADYEVRADKIKAAIEDVRDRFAVEQGYSFAILNRKAGTSVHLDDRCFQSRGDTNSDAFCLSEAGDRALAFAEVKPAHPSSASITTGENSASYEDIKHASDLAEMGALAVKTALD